MLRLVLTGLLLTGVVNGEEGYKGVSSFAIMHPRFPCNEFIRLQRVWDKPAITVLYGTFGNSSVCLSKLVASIPVNKPILLEVHITNEACRRNRRCKRGELLPALSVNRFNTKLERLSPLVWRKVGARKEKIQKLFRSLGERREIKELFITTGLEDNYSRKAAGVMYDILNRDRIGYEIVRNPVSNRRDSRFDFNESHGLRVKCGKGLSIVNNDGTELTKNAMRRFFNRHASCYALFLWYGKLQGIVSRRFISPRNRSFEVPDIDEVKHVIGE